MKLQMCNPVLRREAPWGNDASLTLLFIFAQLSKLTGIRIPTASRNHSKWTWLLFW